MVRTGILALAAAILALSLVPQANAAVGVTAAPRAAVSDVQQIGFKKKKAHHHHKLKKHKKHKKHHLFHKKHH